MSICHALDCKKSGLITNCHNELHDGVSDLTGRAFTPSHVRDDLCIHPCSNVWEGKAQPMASPNNNLPVATENSDQKGELIIRDLWNRETDIICDMRVVNIDTISHKNKSLDKCIKDSEKDDKKKYMESCLHHRNNFYPFVVLVDVLLGVEAEATLKFVASHLATKRNHP